MYKNESKILIFLSIVYLIIGNQTEVPSLGSLSLMGWFGVIQLLYCIASWLSRGNQLISPYVIFLLTLYVFSYGQSFLWAFGLEPSRSLIGFHGITISEIFDAQIITLIMLAFFHIGSLQYIIRHEKKQSIQTECYYDTKKIKKIGWFLFVVSIIPYLSDLIQKVIVSSTLGYAALYEGNALIGINNFSAIIAEYCIPSVICLFIAYKDNILIRNSITVFMLLNVFGILFIGGRTDAVIMIALLLLLYNYLINKFSKKWLIIGVFASFFLLQILTFVANTRTESNRSVNFDGFKVENNAAVDAIAEMGGTMFCLIKSQNIVPNEETYRYGKSYIFAFSTLIPNLGFWDIHPAKKESNLGEWLTQKLGLGYGTGFSMCAEAYVNFGYFAFIVFFLWGWFLASIFGKIDICVQTRNFALLAFLLILFWNFLNVPRNSFINLVRPFFFIAGPIYLYCRNKTEKLL